MTEQQQSGLVVRDGFAGTEQLQLAELASRATAEQARAMVESRFVMALKRPRSEDKFRLAMIKECKRSVFADAAVWQKPVGRDTISGFSIRFVEAALRHWGNVYVSTETIYDDSTKRIVRVTVTDLETNITYPKDIAIAKQVERRKVRDGQTVLAKRQNTEGQTVYIVEASEDELLVKEAALASKAIRTNGLRLLPPDVQAECWNALQETAKAETARDPDAAKKKVADAFAYYNIGPDRLAEYLGKPLGEASPDELRELNSVYTALRENETTWAEALDAKLATRAPKTDAAPSPSSLPAAATTATQRLAQKVAAKAAPVVVETTAKVVEQPKATPTITTDAGAPESPPPSSVPSEQQGTPASPAPDADALTPAAINELRAKLDAVRAELHQVAGKEKAEAAWNGANGVPKLIGVKTKAHAQKRLDAADRLLRLAYVNVEIASAVKAVSAKLGAATATSIAEGLPVLQVKWFDRDLDEAQGALETLVGHIQDAPALDDEEDEPGSDG